MKANKLLIGLTGGICSGKTVVANLFAQLGIDVIDSDLTARTVVEPNTLGYQKIVEHFGKSILNDKQTIDRKKLADIIFNNETEKKWLEDLLHPLIITEIKHQIDQATSPYCIIVIPLLVETKSFYLIDRILLVDTTEEQQLNRAMKRDNVPADTIKKILQAQATRGERIEYADDVIINDGSLEKLKKEVEELHKFYTNFCKQGGKKSFSEW